MPTVNANQREELRSGRMGIGTRSCENTPPFVGTISSLLLGDSIRAEDRTGLRSFSLNGTQETRDELGCDVFSVIGL